MPEAPTPEAPEADLHAYVQTAVLQEFDGNPMSRLRFSHPALALDAIDPKRADYVDGDGVAWTRVGSFRGAGPAGSPYRLRPDHAARIGALVAHRHALLAVLAGLPPDQRTAFDYPTLRPSPVRIERGLVEDLDPLTVREPGPGGEPFEARSDVAAIAAEQAAPVPGLPPPDGSPLMIAGGVPEGWSPAP